MDWQEVVDLINSLARDAYSAQSSSYRDGYTAALADLLEIVQDRAWEEGEDVE